LGVSPTASADEIRDAYRRLARQCHPDAPGGSAARMAAVNEAFRVLRDPGRRALYDTSLRTAPSFRPRPGSGSPHDDGDGDDGAGFVPVAPVTRFAIPIPWLLVLFVLGAIFVFTAYAATSGGRGKGDGVDGFLQAGSCVRLLDTGVAREVTCAGPHDGKVAAISPAHTPCPRGSEPHLDRLGGNEVCVDPTG
jgi:hypothetical protein